jgi:D-glycero-D-manno-heptose 1,7-bisphosphate phosphatase
VAADNTEGHHVALRRAVVFDRDNTLIVNDGYLGDPGGVVLMPGAAAAVAAARRAGFATVVVSNQSGVARGLFDEAAVRAVDQRMAEQLRAADPDATLDLQLYCPFHPQAVVPAYRQDSPLRKPRPGMLLAAARQLGLDLSRSWLIGDAARDVDAGRAAGCRTVLFTPPGVPASPAAGGGSEADATVDALSAAIKFVLAHAD